jgi:hypothetical protein
VYLIIALPFHAQTMVQTLGVYCLRSLALPKQEQRELRAGLVACERCVLMNYIPHLAGKLIISAQLGSAALYPDGK